ncbi:MAG TPA: nitroreductase family protein [Candidatus Omnitrophota bacterium]|nr:nitroreductase family protein [Candidatus Omnitrophota bacterium]HQQ06065.1 nitroreductase family protein [Candidatus Omnitrophota bacterium]
MRARFFVFLCSLSLCVMAAGRCCAADALSVIHSRKSVRHYTGEPATRNEIVTLIKAGMAAPSAVNKQPWQFIAVTDPATLSKLAEKLPYTKMIVKAGACIVVCGDMSKALSGVERDFWVQDCSAASQNILLAAESMGLGAVWSGMYPLQERVEHVRAVLGLPDTVIPLNVIAVGHPAGVEKPQNKFNEANIHWEKW